MTAIVHMDVTPNREPITPYNEQANGPTNSALNKYAIIVVI
jgi:hypothetical protein